MCHIRLRARALLRTRDTFLHIHAERDVESFLRAALEVSITTGHSDVSHHGAFRAAEQDI